MTHKYKIAASPLILMKLKLTHLLTKCKILSHYYYYCCYIFNKLDANTQSKFNYHSLCCPILHGFNRNLSSYILKCHFISESWEFCPCLVVYVMSINLFIVCSICLKNKL